MFATSFSSELYFLFWKIFSASSDMCDSKGKAWKGRGLRLLVILEEEEVVRVAMVSRPLSMEVSPKFCQRKNKCIYLKIMQCIQKQMHLSHTMQLNKEQFVKQNSSKHYHILMLIQSYISCIMVKANLGDFSVCFFVIGHERVFQNVWKFEKQLLIPKYMVSLKCINSVIIYLRLDLLPGRDSLSLGFFFSRDWIRFLASSDRWLGRSNSAWMTLLRVLLTASVSKGGFPTKKVYSMQPRDHTSASRPWADRMAISLLEIKWINPINYCAITTKQWRKVFILMLVRSLLVN